MLLQLRWFSEFLPGWRLEEIAAILPTSGLSISPDSFLDKVNNPLSDYSTELEIPPEASLEGYLFPDSYQLPRQITIDEFIRTLLDNFEVKVDQEMRTSYQSQGLTLRQAVILASIVRREAIVEEEMPLIASVFLNRLSAGMKLDSDPTVQYALGYDTSKATWWKTPLSLEDLEISSPYNTYLQVGFPPGPISNPGLSALKAIAFPSQTTYFYFRAVCDGSGLHNFSQTFEEHQQKACPSGLPTPILDKAQSVLSSRMSTSYSFGRKTEESLYKQYAPGYQLFSSRRHLY